MYVEKTAFITYKATCFDLNYRSFSGLFTFKSINSAYVRIPTCTVFVDLNVRRPEDDL